MTKKVMIIGAGLAGLSAGIRLQELGIESEIFELAPWAGGMCTAWERGGYRFDGCIHWMVGTLPSEPMYRTYEWADALNKDIAIYNAPYIDFEHKGTMYRIPLRAAEFRAFLKSLSEADSKAIDTLCDDIDRVAASELPLGAPSNFAGLMHMLVKSRGFLSLAPKYGKRTVGDVCAAFRSETVRSILTHLMPADFAAFALLMMLGTRMSGNAGYPMGGAYDMTRRILEKYLTLGGTVHYSGKVDRILVENGSAVGVEVAGSQYRADGVIAACDAYDTINRMLDGKYPHPQLEEMLKDTPLFDPLALVSFGLNKRFGFPYAVSLEVPQGIAVSDTEKSYGISLRSFEFDPASAPEGCSSIMVMLGAPLDYWQQLNESDPAAYQKEKQRLANDVAKVIEAHYPGFSSAIEVTDVSTPATYVRLTNVYKGSFEGFAPTKEAMRKKIPIHFPDLRRMLICGQWTTAGGGICTAIVSGKDAAEKMEKELRI